MKTTTIAIDLGTTNTFIYVSKMGIIFNEPTVIAFNKDTKKVIEIGYLAAKMVGRVPYNVEVISPLKDGVIADLDATTSYISQVFSNLKLNKELKGSVILLCTPSQVTKVELQAIIDVAKKLGAKKIHIENEAKMAALGSGVDIFSPRGNLIVDIGGGTTDVAVVTLGELVVTKSTSIAGNEFDEAIIRFLRSKHHLVIGEKTAEYLKMKIGSVQIEPENRLLDVNGRDINSGLPHSVIISTFEIKQVLLPVIKKIADVVIDTLEITPPEIASDIIHNGILLTGGGALLSGAREYFEKELNVPVRIASHPLSTVIDGAKDFLERLDK